MSIWWSCKTCCTAKAMATSVRTYSCLTTAMDGMVHHNLLPNFREKPCAASRALWRSTTPSAPTLSWATHFASYSSLVFRHYVRCEANLQQLWRQDWCFAAAGPKLWNSLPTELRQADISFQRFKQLLKTFLFGCWDRGALWLTVKAAPYKFSYLLHGVIPFLHS